MQPNRRRERSQRTAVVVGAGYAGLAAALDLEDAGVAVTVLEANDRVGGRAWTLRLANGAVAELGGEWVFEGYEELEALAARFGLELVPTGVDFSRREPMGEAASLERQVAFLAAATEALAAIPLAERERRSLGSFLRDLRVDDGARATVEARLRGTCAVPLDRVALASADELLRPEGVGQTRRFGQGAQSLADAIAGRLADVRRRHLVRSVEHGAGGVTVTTADGAVEAGAVVLALPLPATRSLRIDPPPPPEVAGALGALVMGVAGKLVFGLADEPEPATHQSLDGPFWWWTGLGEDGHARRCMTSFAAAPATDAELIEGARSWLGGLLRLAPSVRMEGAARFQMWGSDPLAGGAYSAIPPGAAPLLPALERPFGRVVLAGEHTAGLRWHGTLEGALRSGRRAARNVRELLGDG